MLSEETVLELLGVDSTTGQLYWRQRVGRKIKAGDKAGWMSATGYVYVDIKGSRFSAHRVVWLCTYGSWPFGDLDHINGEKSDNRPSNLRVVTIAENNRNRHHANRNNTSGALGVMRSGKRFRAAIRVNGKRHNLGTFETAEDAHCAYINAKRKLHPSFTG